VSGRVHSRYQRQLLDTAVAGREVMICLTVRRFFCPDPGCEKVTFAEQVSGLTSRHARRSPELDRALEVVALALGGRAGARLTGKLASGVSRMTLLRLIRALPDPAQSTAPRVLGVDEFALRKGRRYGTVLVDVETRRPVDVLDDRSADSFAAWLQDHPGAEVICRDRAGCYSDGGTRGAPDAVQVADRWHLWHNLGEAVERAVAQHREHLAAATTPPPQATVAGASRETAQPPPPVLRSDRFAVRTRRRHADVHRLLAAGHPMTAVAAELGLSRNTVRRFARAADPEELLVRDGTGHRASALHDYEPYLRQRWNSGATNAAVLWQELRDRGYPGSCRTVRSYLARFRSGPMPTPTAVPPKTRTVTSWIMTKPSSRDDADQHSLDAILASCPQLAAVNAHVQTFAALMTERRGHDLEHWMASALATGEPALKSFVTGLRADQDAVTAGLTLPWSSGSVEGNINRIKMLKRQMYGRAGPDLLRLRILHAN
jgi:transposase